MLRVFARRYSIMASTTDYSTWSREQLVQKLQQLDGSSAVKRAESASGATTPQTPPQQPKKKKKKEMDFSKFNTRKIALRFSYLGWNYNGLAVQNSENEQVRTIENEILRACHTTKLIPTMDVNDCDFSRCGRTDRGVSALRQVISLRVRSLLSSEEQQDESKDNRELDYLHIINNLLPNDIRIFEICMRPGDGFDARFSCLSRHYKYFFVGDGLDIDKMNEAAALFIGEHDFRNFCKVDASKQITNFKRTIIKSSIEKHGESGNMYYFDLKGTAFLWHQVRSMIAVLLLVGQRLEQPQVITDLLSMANRPVYEMAADYPLVLYDCEFPSDMQWKSFRNGETAQRVKDGAYNIWYEQCLKATMANEMVQMLERHSSFDNPKTPKTFINTGDGKGRAINKYVPLDSRQRLDTPEVINQRWLDKQQK